VYFSAIDKVLSGGTVGSRRNEQKPTGKEICPAFTIDENSHSAQNPLAGVNERYGDVTPANEPSLQVTVLI